MNQSFVLDYQGNPKYGKNLFGSTLTGNHYYYGYTKNKPSEVGLKKKKHFWATRFHTKTRFQPGLVLNSRISHGSEGT